MEWMWAAMGATEGGSPNTGYNKGYAGATGSSQTSIGQYAWYYSNNTSTGNSAGKTHQIGKKLPNELGLFDMTGNVLEWCWDLWINSYPNNDLTDYRGPDTTGVTWRVTRGGSYEEMSMVDYEIQNRPAGIASGLSYDDIGLRIVRRAE
jgi:formylglycine-generating enzyme required for sulfatase activity